MAYHVPSQENRYTQPVVTQTTPLRQGYETGAGEYETEYRPDVQAYYMYAHQQNQQQAQWQQQPLQHQKGHYQHSYQQVAPLEDQRLYHRQYRQQYRQQYQQPQKQYGFGQPPPTPPSPPSPLGEPSMLPGPAPNFRPVPLKFTFIAVLILIVMGLMAITEYACQTLPVEANPSVAPITSYTAATTTPSPTASSFRPLMMRIPPSSAYGQNGTVSVVISTSSTSSTTSPSPPPNPTSSDYGGDGSITITSSGDGGGDTTETPMPSNYAGIGSTTFSSGDGTTAGGGGGGILGSTTLNGVVTTVVGATTVNGVVSSFVGATTVDGVASTFTSATTLNGIVSTFTQATTLNGVVTAIGPTYQTAVLETLTNVLGLPTATITSIPSAFSTPTVVTLTNSNGVPTATVTTSVLATPTTTVLTNSNGVPTATVTEYPVQPSQTPSTEQVAVFFLSGGDYFIGFFLPTVVGVLLTLPVRMIDLAAKQFQPFHELTHQRGASVPESLGLKTSGLNGLVASIRSLFGGRALVFLTTLLVLFSAAIVPIASEAVSLKLHGYCTMQDFNGCAMILSVYLVPARMTIAFLGAMILLMLVILIYLARWRSGVATNPWSIASIAALSTNPDIRSLLTSLPTEQWGTIRQKTLVDALDGRMFKLGYFVNSDGMVEYGIVIHHQIGAPLKVSDGSSSVYSSYVESGGAAGGARKAKPDHHVPFLLLTYWARLVFLLILTGLLVLILYYNNTGGDTGFENFLDSQSFGVRFVFTLVGICITFFWSSFFTSESL